MHVRRAVEADWQQLRALRLQALQDAPLAFASTHAREVAFADQVWRDRIAESAQFLAFDDHDDLDDNDEGRDGALVGTATGYADPARPDEMLLVAMFVRPESRGRGAAGRLVEAVWADAEKRGFARLVLEVVETNGAAASAYRRAGFIPTGRTAPLPHAPELLEIEMVLPLSPATPSGPADRRPARSGPPPAP